MMAENTWDNAVTLNSVIENLKFHYENLARTYSLEVQNSRPEYVNFYADVWECFEKAAISCENYFSHLNILQLCKEQLDLGFVNEVNKLKNHITDCNIKQQLCSILKNYEDERYGDGQEELFI